MVNRSAEVIRVYGATNVLRDQCECGKEVEMVKDNKSNIKCERRTYSCVGAFDKPQWEPLNSFCC